MRVSVPIGMLPNFWLTRRTVDLKLSKKPITLCLTISHQTSTTNVRVNRTLREIIKNHFKLLDQG